MYTREYRDGALMVQQVVNPVGRVVWAWQATYSHYVATGECYDKAVAIRSAKDKIEALAARVRADRPDRVM